MDDRVKVALIKRAAKYHRSEPLPRSTSSDSLPTDTEKNNIVISYGSETTVDDSSVPHVEKITRRHRSLAAHPSPHHNIVQSTQSITVIRTTIFDDRHHSDIHPSAGEKETDHQVTVTKKHRHSRLQHQQQDHTSRRNKYRLDKIVERSDSSIKADEPNSDSVPKIARNQKLQSVSQHQSNSEDATDDNSNDHIQRSSSHASNNSDKKTLSDSQASTFHLPVNNDIANNVVKLEVCSEITKNVSSLVQANSSERGHRKFSRNRLTKRKWSRNARKLFLHMCGYSTAIIILFLGTAIAAIILIFTRFNWTTTTTITSVAITSATTTSVIPATTTATLSTTTSAITTSTTTTSAGTTSATTPSTTTTSAIPATTTATLSTTTSVGTTSVTTTSTTVTSSTTTSATTSSTTTSTTTTQYLCNYTCINQSYAPMTSLIASFSFDGTFTDDTNTSSVTPNNGPTFVTNGYINQAISFTSNASQSLSASYMPLANTSFTVSVWVFPTGYSNAADNSILGLCPTKSAHNCLQLVIRKIGSNHVFYLGFYGDDCTGTTPVPLNTWTYVSFVFNLTTLKQSIYFNGALDCSRTASAPLLATTSNVTIGSLPNLISSVGLNYFQGYLDQLTVVKQTETTCGILDQATLAAQFTFDSGSPLVDSGPNSVSTTASSYLLIASGHPSQAISFTGSSSSYFQASGFTAFGTSNQSFSISLWILPQSLLGTLVHLSTSTTGNGSRCFPLLGFTSSGALTAQIYNGAVSSVAAPSLLPLSSSWSLVVQTWSSTNGLRLYVNNTLVASNSSTKTFVSSGITPNYVTLANSLSASGSCPTGAVSILGPFTGAVDDFRIYTRELSAADVCTLYIS